MKKALLTLNHLLHTKEENVLEPQTIQAIGQAGEWFQVKINNEIKWIHSPSAKFEGTKASLLQDAAPIRTKRAAAMYAIEEKQRIFMVYL